METLFWLIGQVFWTIFGILLWVLKQLVWLVLWFLLPFAILAFIALRVAEKTLGREAVRSWVKKHTQRYGKGAWRRSQRAVTALGAMPFRVLFWFVIYTITHSLQSLLWRPRWHPWTRAWKKRWRQRPT